MSTSIGKYSLNIKGISTLRLLFLITEKTEMKSMKNIKPRMDMKSIMYREECFENKVLSFSFNLFFPFISSLSSKLSFDEKECILE
jgi:hypothetical protein